MTLLEAAKAAMANWDKVRGELCGFHSFQIPPPSPSHPMEALRAAVEAEEIRLNEVEAEEDREERGVAICEACGQEGIYLEGASHPEEGCWYCKTCVKSWVPQ